MKKLELIKRIKKELPYYFDNGWLSMNNQEMSDFVMEEIGNLHILYANSYFSPVIKGLYLKCNTIFESAEFSGVSAVVYDSDKDIVKNCGLYKTKIDKNKSIIRNIIEKYERS